MQSVPFKEQNVILGEDQPQLESLPVCSYDMEAGAGIVHCWRMTWKEKIKVLLTGIVWVNVRTYGDSPKPMILTVDSPFK